DPFSIPVIHCFGAFLAMMASSLSVSILMARSSSTTRDHVWSSGDSARTDPSLAIAMSNTADDQPAKEALDDFMRRPRLRLSWQFVVTVPWDTRDSASMAVDTHALPSGGQRVEVRESSGFDPGLRQIQPVVNGGEYHSLSRLDTRAAVRQSSGGPFLAS